jgi:hypothetical protein
MIDYKFALIGTTCAGKTTLAYKAVSELKRRGVNADGIFQQDRRLPFDKEYLEEEEQAQYWVILNQAAKELEMTVGRPPKVMVSDRSVVDFYAYLEQMYNEWDREENTSMMMWEFVARWAESYDTLYYLDPLPYEDDGARPDDDFRMSVDRRLERIIGQMHNNPAIDVSEISRDAVVDDILTEVDAVESHDNDGQEDLDESIQDAAGDRDGRHEMPTTSEITLINEVLGEGKVMIAGSYAADGEEASDIDVYIPGNDEVEVSEYLSKVLENVYGVPFDVTLVTDKVWQYLMSREPKMVIEGGEIKE